MKDIFKTTSGNQYLYLKSQRSLYFVPQEGQSVDLGLSITDEEYQQKRLAFLREQESDEEIRPQIKTTYTKEEIESNLANTRQLLLEVTDGCNLSCKYCGYGELYGNYDQRMGKRMTFETVRTLIDYLVPYWKRSADVSYGNIIAVGFYGGEPLLNMKLIRETIAYLESLELPVSFIYNMTTNAYLLDKCMDFLVEKKFHLLISLDGDKQGNSYRVKKNGEESFAEVVRNVQALKDNYPEYFEQYVEFNSVLHNRNSVEKTIDFIHRTFGKVPTVGGLNTNGIIEEKREEFERMFKNEMESFEEAHNSTLLEDDVLVKDPKTMLLYGFLDAFIEGLHRTYISMYYHNDFQNFVPTGTCAPFERKIFLTVNGKLFPCERIGQLHPLGYIDAEGVHLDFEHTINLYKERFEQLKKYCSTCVQWRHCGMCIYHLKEKDGKYHCELYSPASKATGMYLTRYLDLLEHEPLLFKEAFTEMTVS